MENVCLLFTFCPAASSKGYCQRPCFKENQNCHVTKVNTLSVSEMIFKSISIFPYTQNTLCKQNHAGKINFDLFTDSSVPANNTPDTITTTKKQYLWFLWLLALPFMVIIVLVYIWQTAKGKEMIVCRIVQKYQCQSFLNNRSESYQYLGVGALFSLHSPKF